MKQGHLFLFFGPSGVGKSTTIKSLLDENLDYIQIPSYTTRPIRSDDIESNARIHVTKKEFEQLIKEDALADWIEYSNFLYGKKKQDIQDTLDQGKTIVLDADYRGIIPYRKLFKNSTLILMKYQSLEDQKERLRIGRPDITKEEIERRHQIGLKEMSVIDNYDYVITTRSDQSPAVPASIANEIIHAVLSKQNG